MSSIVAIVGRPNVGKSTLFNRILRQRSAIVDDVPGVTRDRHYGTTDWNGKTFTVIDTGGYVPQSADVFERAIREQAEIAIEEAHAVVFVVDVLDGVTPLDEEIARILHRSNKKVFLVANKIDNTKREVDAAQFFPLGFGEPLAVSALGGRRIGDFLDVVTAAFPKNGEEVEEGTRTLKLAIVGKPNVGKSSLVNALLGKRRNIVTHVPGTTRDAIDSVLKYQGEKILLIDTAGLRRKSRIKESVEFYSTIRSLKSIDRCDIALWVVDVAGGVDKQDIRVLEAIYERRRGAVLVANKWDLVEKNDQTASWYESEMKKLLRLYDFIPVIFVSALEKKRIYKLIDMAKTVYAEQHKRLATNKLNSVLLREIAMTSPAAVRGKEIKINYVTQVKVDPPTFVFFTNEPTLIEDRYKRFLEKKIRENFGFTGVPIVVLFRRKNS